MFIDSFHEKRKYATSMENQNYLTAEVCAV